MPPHVTTTGAEAVELAAYAGQTLDPWEQLVLRESLGERADGKWSAFEVGVVCPRQNGKTEILIARMLAGLFLLGERLIIFSAHQFDTSLEAFQRLCELIDNTPEFRKRVQKISNAHGKEGITLTNGQRVRFRARTRKGGRGFTADCLIYDEAMDLPESAHGSTLPTLSARPNPQVWYAASAVDQLHHEHGVVLARVRERAVEGKDDSLAYFEWSAEGENPATITDELATDPQAWAQANPALGIRITAEHVAREQRSMDPRTFAVERLGIGDWPRTDGLADVVIPVEKWQALADADSTANDPIVLAFDVSPDRSSASIGAAGIRDDGLAHVEVVDSKRGTGWVPKALEQLSKLNRPAAIYCDPKGPAGSLLGECMKLGIEVEPVSAGELGQACGLFFDHVEEAKLRHLGTDELESAIRGASKRPLVDAWAWSRTQSTVDISPLVAVTLALWGAVTRESGESVYQDKELLILA